jgi:hypothetical protein
MTSLPPLLFRMHTFRFQDLMTRVLLKSTTMIESDNSTFRIFGFTSIHFPPKCTTSEVRDPLKHVPPDPTTQMNFRLRPSGFLSPSYFESSESLMLRSLGSGDTYPYRINDPDLLWLPMTLGVLHLFSLIVSWISYLPYCMIRRRVFPGDQCLGSSLLLRASRVLDTQHKIFPEVSFLRSTWISSTYPSGSNNPYLLHHFEIRLFYNHCF